MNRKLEILDSIQEYITSKKSLTKPASSDILLETDILTDDNDPDDISNSGSKPGLWDNIRKKKEREGKKYRPAKPGDKDRPDPKQWKKLTKD